MNMNSAPKGSAQEEMEIFAEEQTKKQAEERTAKKKAESVIQENNAKNILKLSKKIKSDRENLLKKIELEDEIRSNSEDIFEGVLPVYEKTGETISSTEDIQKASPENTNTEPPAPLRKRPVGRPRKIEQIKKGEPMASLDEIRKPSIETNNPPARLRESKIQKNRGIESETINGQEYLTKAEETGNKVAEMISARKAKEKAEKDAELKKETEPEDEIKLEAEKQFDAKAKNLKTALEDARIKEELAKKAEELEKKIGEKLERKKSDKKNEEIRQQLESAYNPSDTELFLENKISEIEKLIEQNDSLEKEFEKLFKKFEEMNYTSFFNWERMKYIMTGDQDADKEKLMEIIETMEINDSQIKKKDENLNTGLDGLKKELGESGTLGKTGLLINKSENKFKDYLINRPAKIKEMLDKMK